jgi:hypothetical protein
LQEAAVAAGIEDNEDLSLVTVSTKRKKIERKKKITKSRVLIAIKEIEKRRNIDLDQDHKTSTEDMRIIMKDKRKRKRM